LYYVEQDVKLYIFEEISSILIKLFKYISYKMTDNEQFRLSV